MSSEIDYAHRKHWLIGLYDQNRIRLCNKQQFKLFKSSETTAATQKVDNLSYFPGSAKWNLMFVSEAIPCSVTHYIHTGVGGST